MIELSSVRMPVRLSRKASAVTKSLPQSEASTPILYLLLRSEWMALLGTNILTSELCHTPSVAPV